MSSDIQISAHEAIIIDLGNTRADGFLEQHPACVFFIGQEAAEGVQVPHRAPGGIRDMLLSQPIPNGSQSSTFQVSSVYLPYRLGLFGDGLGLSVLAFFIGV